MNRVSLFSILVFPIAILDSVVGLSIHKPSLQSKDENMWKIQYKIDESDNLKNANLNDPNILINIKIPSTQFEETSLRNDNNPKKPDYLAKMSDLEELKNKIILDYTNLVSDIYNSELFLFNDISNMLNKNNDVKYKEIIFPTNIFQGKSKQTKNSISNSGDTSTKKNENKPIFFPDNVINKLNSMQKLLNNVEYKVHKNNELDIKKVYSHPMNILKKYKYESDIGENFDTTVTPYQLQSPSTVEDIDNNHLNKITNRPKPVVNERIVPNKLHQLLQYSEDRQKYVNCIESLNTEKCLNVLLKKINQQNSLDMDANHKNGIELRNKIKPNYSVGYAKHISEALMTDRSARSSDSNQCLDTKMGYPDLQWICGPYSSGDFGKYIKQELCDEDVKILNLLANKSKSEAVLKKCCQKGNHFECSADPRNKRKLMMAKFIIENF